MKMKVIWGLFLVLFGLVMVYPGKTGIKVEAAGDNLANPRIVSDPLVKWGNSSFHDSLGIRDPYVIEKDNYYYLYFDCIEDFLNPSFESNLTTNGWNTYKASISSTNTESFKGQSSLKMVTEAVSYAGAYTSDYYYDLNDKENSLAMPGGLEVMAETNYVVSAYVKATAGNKMGVVIQEYRDDPFFSSQNRIFPSSVVSSYFDTQKGWYRSEVIANGDWQRIWVPFRTQAETRVINISLVSSDGVVTTSYWDAIQIERVDNLSNGPSAFPDFDFNQRIDRIIGWKSCLAKALKKTNVGDLRFEKMGLVKVSGEPAASYKYEKQGWVGTSGMYFNVFEHDNKFYALSWVAGYPVSPDSTLVTDKGASNRRFAYGDRRGQLPNGTESRSAMLVSNSVVGPFEHLTEKYPILDPVNFDDGDPRSCNQAIRSCQSALGCEYITSIGVPHLVDGKWFLFLAADTYFQKDVWGGTLGQGICGCHAITGSVATGPGPLGPWQISKIGNELFHPYQVCSVGSYEGPMYYFDKGSSKHVLFVNGISGGAHSIEALWNDSVESSWNLNNRVTAIDWKSSQYNWANAEGGNINLATVKESSDNKKLFLFFGVRDRKAIGENSNYLSYLFHDIGGMEFDFPLLGTDAVIKNPNLNDPNLETSITKYVSISGEVNQMQFVISPEADWRKGNEEIRAMYIDGSAIIGSKTLGAGLYLYDASNTENFGWGNPTSLGEWQNGRFGKVRVISVNPLGLGKILTWQVRDVGLGTDKRFNQYIWYVDKNSGAGGVKMAGAPHEVVDVLGVGYNFQMVGSFVNETQVCAGSDANRDGVVNIGDLIIWYSAYRNGYKVGADFNCDGKVDIADLIKWYKEYKNI